MNKPTVDRDIFGNPCLATMEGEGGLKSDPNDWFYRHLKRDRDSVTQFLNSHGIEKGDTTYIGVTDYGEHILHSILRYRLHVEYGDQNQEPPPALEKVLKKISIKGDQLLGAILYLELGDKLQKILTINIKGKNNISEENCIEVAVILAEMEMCATAIGLQGMQNSLQAVIGRKGGKKESGLRHDLRKFCQEVDSTSWPKVKAAIKNRGIVNELRESAIDPIRLRDFRFSGPPGDRREERKEDVLHYTTRDNQPKKILVASVRKILSKIKKENNL